MEQWPLFRILHGEVLQDGNAPDIMMHTRDGRDLLLNIHGMPKRDASGTITGAICIVRDVTERYLLERERLLEERAEAQANEMALRAAHRRMDDFLGMASHELKTPLTAINGYIALAGYHLSTLLDSPHASSTSQEQEMRQVQDMLKRAERHGDLMHRLVNDLLDVSRILGGKLNVTLRPCNLATIVHDTVYVQSMMMSQRTIRLKSPLGRTVPVLADADRISQVIMNYLTNAHKYSPFEQPVEIDLHVEGSMAKVTVRDQGPGLSPLEQDRAWQRFYQVKEVDAQIGMDTGLGLGLHICKTIIEQHQGAVGVESTPGQGCTFWFTLPLA